MNLLFFVRGCVFFSEASKYPFCVDYILFIKCFEIRGTSLTVNTNNRFSFYLPVLFKRGFSEAAFPKREKTRHKHLISALQCTYKSRWAMTWERVDCGTSWPVGRLQIIWYSSQLVPIQFVHKSTRPHVNSSQSELVPKWTRTQVKTYSSELVPKLNS